MVKIHAQKARLYDDGLILRLHDDRGVFVNAQDMSEWGTQKIYGRNGVNIVCKDRWTGEYYIVPVAWNEKFSRRIKKVLPTKRAHVGGNPVSVIWGDKEIAAKVVDSMVGMIL